jgi:hypothetical protein
LRTYSLTLEVAPPKRGAVVRSRLDREARVGDRIQILEAIERGEMSVQEAVRRLQGTSDVSQAAAASALPPAASPSPLRMNREISIWSGAALDTAGGILAAASHVRSIWTGWVLLGLDVATSAVAWWMRAAQRLGRVFGAKRGTKVTLRFPVPASMAYWALRNP